MPWPKGKPRGPRKPVQAGPVEAVHEPIRAGAVAVRGRNGEVLTRKRTQSSDIFFIPSDIIPPGYSYQWNVLEVIGQPQVAARLAMQENGWRPVPSGRHPGRFMPEGTGPNEPIVRDGLILEERPIELTAEAQAEEAAKARQQITDQQQQLGLARKLPDGFSRDNPNLARAERQQTSRRMAPEPGVSRPALPIDPNG